MPGPEARRITIAPQLRRNSLGLGELVFHGITHIAPAANIILTFPVIALKSGPAMPISFLLTTTVCCFIANTVSEFSKCDLCHHLGFDISGNKVVDAHNGTSRRA